MIERTLIDRGAKRKMSPGVNSKERAAKRARETLCSTFERAEVSPNLLKYDTFAQNATQGDVAYVFGILPTSKRW